MADIDELFQQLLDNDGSDLHLMQGQPPKIRCHGHVNVLEDYDVLDGVVIKHLLKEITSEEHWKRFEKTGDLDFAYGYGDGVRFRANYYKQVHG